MFVKTVELDGVIESEDPAKIVQFLENIFTTYDKIIKTYEKVHKVRNNQQEKITQFKNK